MCRLFRCPHKYFLFNQRQTEKPEHGVSPKSGFTKILLTPNVRLPKIPKFSTNITDILFSFLPE